MKRACAWTQDPKLHASEHLAAGSCPSLSQNPGKTLEGETQEETCRPEPSAPATALSKDPVTSGRMGWLCSQCDKVQRTPDSFFSPCLPLRTELPGVTQKQNTTQSHNVAGPRLRARMSGLVRSSAESQLCCVPAEPPHVSATQLIVCLSAPWVEPE